MSESSTPMQFLKRRIPDRFDSLKRAMSRDNGRPNKVVKFAKPLVTLVVDIPTVSPLLRRRLFYSAGDIENFRHERNRAMMVDRCHDEEDTMATFSLISSMIPSPSAPQPGPRPALLPEPQPASQHEPQHKQERTTMIPTPLSIIPSLFEPQSRPRPALRPESQPAPQPEPQHKQERTTMRPTPLPKQMVSSHDVTRRQPANVTSSWQSTQGQMLTRINSNHSRARARNVSLREPAPSQPAAGTHILSQSSSERTITRPPMHADRGVTRASIPNSSANTGRNSSRSLSWPLRSEKNVQSSQPRSPAKDNLSAFSWYVDQIQKPGASLL